MSDQLPHQPTDRPSDDGRARFEGTPFSKLVTLLDRLIPGSFVCLLPEAGLPCLYVNRAFLETLGYKIPERFHRESGGLFENCLHPEDAPALAAFVARIVEGSTIDTSEGAFRIRKKDRSYAWISFAGRCFNREEGPVAVCSCIDLTESIVAQHELEKQQQELCSVLDDLRSLVANMPGGLHVFELGVPAKVIYLSDNLCAMTGYSRAEVNEKFHNQYIEMLHPDDRILLQEALFDLKEYPHTVILSYRIARKDGSILYVSDTIRSVRDPHGRMWAYAIVIDDIHDSLSFSGVSGASAHIPYPIACFDWSDRVLRAVYCNEEFSSIMGLTPAEYMALTARTPLSLAVEGSRQAILDTLGEFERGRNSATLDIVVNSKEGPQRCTFILNVISRCGLTFRVLALLENDFYRKLGTLARLDRGEQPKPKRVKIRTFGYFDVFVDGKALSFHSSKAKELLALLVDRRGGFVTSAEIIGNLWEDEPANKVTRARCRKIAMRLINELKEQGVEDIVESTRNGARRIVPEKVDCDLFDYLAGNPESVSLFKGSYMTNYSWGEYTLAELYSNAQ